MKYIIGLAFILISINSYAGNWRLINSEFNGGVYYCTYQLQGSGITSTIRQQFYCASYISE